MNEILIEDFIEKLKCDVYPITFIKFVINRNRVLSYFMKASNKNISIYGIQHSLDKSKCQKCLEKQSLKIPCRQHSSIERILTSENVAYDIDTKLYFYRNEIFKKLDNGRIVIIFCPHTKLISGQITNDKIKKVIPITVEIPNISLPNYNNILNFSSNLLFNLNLKCWFNNEFSILTIPKSHDDSEFCLIPNY